MKTRLHLRLLPAVLSTALAITASRAIATAPTTGELCISVLSSASANKSDTDQRDRDGSVSAIGWESRFAEISSAFGQKLVRTSYKFINRAAQPISLVSIEPSCGCVSTQIDKLDFAPGESGELKVTLDLTMDAAVGTQERFLIVRTSDTASRPTTLRLVVHEPEAFHLSSDFVRWERGEKPEAKVVSIEAGAGVEHFTLSQPTGSNEDFTVDVTPEIPGQRYRMRITPKTTDAPLYAQVRLFASSSSFARPIVCKINLNVK